MTIHQWQSVFNIALLVVVVALWVYCRTLYQMIRIIEKELRKK